MEGFGRRRGSLGWVVILGRDASPEQDQCDYHSHDHGEHDPIVIASAAHDRARTLIKASVSLEL